MNKMIPSFLLPGRKHGSDGYCGILSGSSLIAAFEDNEGPDLLAEADLVLAEMHDGMKLDMKVPHVPSGPVILGPAQPKAPKAPKAAKAAKGPKLSPEEKAAAKAAAKAI